MQTKTTNNHKVSLCFFSLFGFFSSHSAFQITMGFGRERFACPVDNFICAICHDVIENPAETPCRHTFCRACITQQLSHRNRCPTCNRQPIQQTDLERLNPIVKSLHDGLQIRCRHVNRGCTEVLLLENVSRHESECGFAGVRCEREQCGEIVNRSYFQEHTRNECPWRELPCPNDCGSIIAACELNNHKKECQMALVVCPNRCDSKVRRREVTQHINEFCENSLIKCVIAGCSFQAKRREKTKVNDHLSTNSNQHFVFMSQSLAETQKQNKELTTSNQELRATTERLEQNNQELRASNQELSKNNQELRAS